jgi:hypothetical protein
VPAAGIVIEAGDLGVVHELGASMVVVSEIAELTHALTPEQPAATAAVSAVHWTVAVKRVECMHWLLARAPIATLPTRKRGRDLRNSPPGDIGA